MKLITCFRFRRSTKFLRVILAKSMNFSYSLSNSVSKLYTAGDRLVQYHFLWSISYTYIHKCMHTYIHTYIHTHTHTHVRTYVRTTYIHTCKHTHTLTHTRARARAHAHRHAFAQKSPDTPSAGWPCCGFTVPIFHAAQCFSVVYWWFKHMARYFPGVI
jgi:hypothetical protein